MSAENRSEELTVIIMGSGGDEKHADVIAAVMQKFGVDYVKRVGSAHKTPKHVLGIVNKYDALVDRRIAYITVAGRADALSAFVDGASSNPVTAAPPYGEKYAGQDVLSSLRVPSGIGTAVCIEAEAAALHTIKIFALSNPKLRHALDEYHLQSALKVTSADARMQVQNQTRGVE